MRILLVDDEKDLLDQAKIFLEKIDDRLDIDIVTSGEEALKKIEKKDYDGVVSDYQMPEMDGLDFLNELREERGDDIPFIMFTGKGREEVAMKALNLGADRYMQKGGDPKSQYGVLAQAIKQEVTHYKTEMEKRHYTRELQFLNKILIKVSRMKDPDEICEYVADKVYTLNEDDYVTVALYDFEKETIRIRAVKGFDDYTQLVEGLMNSEQELTFDPDIKDEWSNIYSSGNLERMPQGLYSLVKGVLSKEESQNIEELLGVEEVYSVGFSLKNKPYGGISILKTSEQDVKFSSAIETIGSHLSVILQRRQYEEQLRRNRKKIKKRERKYRRLFNSIQDAILVADTDRDIINCNQAFTDLFGYGLEEIKGKKTEFLYHDDEQFEKMGDEIGGHEEENDFYFTIDYEKKSGEVFPGDTKVSYLRDDEGEITGFIGLIRDITQRKEAEKELGEVKERYDALFERSMDAVYIHDLEGNILDANQAALEIFGYKRDDLENLDFTDLLPEDQIEKALKTIEEVIKSGKQEKLTTFEVKAAENGERRIMETKSSLIYKDEEPYAILGIGRDITEKKEMEEKLKASEKKFRSSFSASPDPTFLLNKEGIFEDVNKVALEKLGFDRDKIVGKKLQEVPFLKGEEIEKTVNKFERRKSGEHIPPYEIRLFDKEGGKINVEVNAGIIEGNGFEGEIVIARDITERTKIEKERKELLQKIGERYKELNCLYKITRLGTDPANSIEDFLEGTLDVIKQSWQYPEAIEAKIELKGDEYTTENFVESDLFLPSDIELNGKKIGSVTVVNTEKKSEVDEDPFLEEEKELLESITTIISSVIQRDETERELEESEQKLKKLYEITPKIEAAEDFDELNELIIETAKNILDFDVCSVEIEEEGELVVKASTEEDLVEKEYSMPIDEGIAGQSFREGRSYLTTDINKEDEAKPTDSDFRSAISIPMGNIGVFQALSYKKNYYDENDLELAELFVSYVTEAVKRLDAVKALKESEERYRTLVETSFAGISITDFDNNFTFVNEQFAEMLGYEKEELVGKNIKEISPEGELDKFGKETEIRKDGETSYYESSLIRKDGEEIDVLVYGSPFKNADGKYIGTMGVVTDITDRKRAQEREELLHTLLRHDIKNKAQVVQGYLQLLNEEDLPQETKKYIDKALKSNKESVNLIQKIRLLLSAHKEEHKSVNVVSTIHEAVEDVEMIADEKNMTLDMECPSKDCKVEAGPLLKEVFSNLIENSIYHSEGSNINISGDIKEDEVICTVEDDGKGIPDDKKENVFERGFSTDDKRGTGLGLFLVKMLLETYGGSIEVKDSEMGGARFDVRMKKTK